LPRFAIYTPLLVLPGLERQGHGLRSRYDPVALGESYLLFVYALEILRSNNVQIIERGLVHLLDVRRERRIHQAVQEECDTLQRIGHAGQIGCQFH
jgi:hypothetical protein